MLDYWIQYYLVCKVYMFRIVICNLVLRAVCTYWVVSLGCNFYGVNFFGSYKTHSIFFLINKISIFTSESTLSQSYQGAPREWCCLKHCRATHCHQQNRSTVCKVHTRISENDINSIYYSCWFITTSEPMPLFMMKFSAAVLVSLIVLFNEDVTLVLAAKNTRTPKTKKPVAPRVGKKGNGVAETFPPTKAPTKTPTKTPTRAPTCLGLVSISTQWISNEKLPAVSHYPVVHLLVNRMSDAHRMLIVVYLT